MKNKIYKLLSIIIVLSLFLLSNSFEIFATIEPLSFVLNSDGGGYTLTSCSPDAVFELNIPSTYKGKPVVSIGDGAFSGCDKLYKISIPSSIKSIGDGVFYRCSQLALIECDSTSFVVKNGCLYSSDNRRLIYLIDKSLTSLTVVGGTESISAYCFADSAALKSIELPNTLKSIGKAAFSCCTSLKTLSVPPSVSVYPDHMLSGCTSLLGVSVEASVKSIGRGCFFNCTSLRSVLVPSATAVGEDAFASCPSLTVYCSKASSCQAVASACGVDTIAVNYTGTHRPTSVFVMPTLPISVGQSQELSAGVRGNSVEVINTFFVSSNPDVIEISGRTMTAKRVGSAIVTVYTVDGLHSDSREVTVGKNAALLESAHDYLPNTDDTQTYTVTGSPSHIKLTFSSLTYTEPDKDYIFISDGEGNSCGVFSGDELAGRELIIPSDTVSIRLCSDSEVNYYGYAVSSIIGCDGIVFPESISLNKTEHDMSIAQSIKLTPSAYPTDSYYERFYFRSSDRNVLDVDEDGNVYAVGVGVAYITVFAKYGEATAECKITVKDNSSNGFVYEKHGSECTITYYKGENKNVVIPEKLGGCKVTAIAPYAFGFNSKINSVSIPSGVVDISPYSFAGASGLTAFAVSSSNKSYFSTNGALYSADFKTLVCVGGGISGKYALPEGVVTISPHSFAYCSKITEIEISSTVREISPDAFEGCVALTSFSVSSKNTNYSVYDSCIYSLDKSTLFVCPSAKSGDITLHSSCRTVKARTFYDCYGIKRITVPSGVTNIEYGAFYQMHRLTYISVASANKSYASYGGALYSKDMKTLAYVPSSLEGGYSVHPSCEYIGEYAFCHSSLNEVILPYGLLSIGDNAFYGADGISSLILPPNVGTVGNNCFEGCSNMTLVCSDSVIIVGTMSDGCKAYCPSGGKSEAAFKKSGVDTVEITYLYDDEYKLSVIGSSDILLVGSELNVGAFALGPIDVYNIEYYYKGARYEPGGYASVLLYTDFSLGESIEVTTDSGEKYRSDNTAVGFMLKGSSFTVSPSSLDKTVERLAIKTMPSKTEYKLGQSLDTSGLELYYISDDGKICVISTGFTAKCSLDKSGENEVTVTYLNHTVKYSVNVSMQTLSCNLTLSGEGRLGSTLHATVSALSPVGITYSIEWYRNGVRIDGASSFDYVVAPADMGCNVYALVKAANGFNGQVKSNEVYIEITKISSEVYSINESLSTISKIPLGTTCSAFLSRLSPSSLLKVEKNGAAVSSSAKLGTGMTVSLVKDGKVYQKLDIVLTGDINGDGAVSITDFVRLKTRLFDDTSLNGAYVYGADVNGDGKITITDLVQMKSHLLGNSSITAKEVKRIG